MPINPERRTLLADAGLHVLAVLGSRGLTHRAVDAEAQVPAGTTSNYFRSRNELLAALCDRIFERLAPDEAVLQQRAQHPPTIDLFVHYVQDIVERVEAQPQLWLALLELRLEATRNPAVAESVSVIVRRNYRMDVLFHTGAGLPGGGYEVALLHYAIDGLILDRLTVSIDARNGEAGQAVDDLVRRLVPDC